MSNVFFMDRNGAGDSANILPILRLVQQHGHTVFTSKQLPIYENTGIGCATRDMVFDYTISCDFSHEVNVPSMVIPQRVKEALGLDITGEFHQGLAYSKEEQRRLAGYKKSLYVNIFPYTTIRQKRIPSSIVRELVNHIKSTYPGYKVLTSISDVNKYNWDRAFEHADGTHPLSSYFSREWLLAIAGAQLNICVDGGPVNVSLASGSKTLGLLTIADKRLCTLYPSEQWRVVQSMTKCSPCFKAADYGTCEVLGCLQSSDPCGNYFDMSAVKQAIAELLCQ